MTVGGTTSGTGATASFSVSVIVTVKDDPRLERTLESLLSQTLPPAEVLVADGAHSPVVRAIAERFAARDHRVRRLDAPGTIAESRNAAIAAAQAEIVAFLDTDEVAPPDWLARLVAAFRDPEVGFTGGPTPAAPGTSHTLTARYYDAYLRRFYDRVASGRPHALPMGNTAWRAEVFRRVGRLDLSLSGIGSEDQDMEVRALAAGWKARYVPEAAVAHDFTEIGPRTLFRKQRKYSKGGYIVWRRWGATYEASPSRILPYVLFPALVVVGLILLAPVPTRFAGALTLLAGTLGLVALALWLTAEGIRGDATYPGYRFRALEIPRRWATLVGAFEGFLAYRRRARPASRPGSPGPPSPSLAGKP